MMKAESLTIPMFVFYCKKNIKEMIESAELKVIYSEGSIKNYKGNSIAKIINRVTFGLLEEFFSTQYFFKVKK